MGELEGDPVVAEHGAGVHVNAVEPAGVDVVSPPDGDESELCTESVTSC